MLHFALHKKVRGIKNQGQLEGQKSAEQTRETRQCLHQNLNKKQKHRSKGYIYRTTGLLH